METFRKLFGSLLALVYHCFDRIVVQGYLPLLTRPEHIVRMTWYIRDREAYLSSARVVGEIYRDIIGLHYPAMAVVEISALMESDALVEIETTAVVPD